MGAPTRFPPAALVAAAILASACAVAGCHPREGRLLIVDFDRSDSSATERTARPWRGAGYRVAYRPSYPHLTHADLNRYAAVLVLGGRGGDAAAARLGAGDLVLLGEWVERGGVIVLGYTAEGDGAFDRWMMNRWLAWRGAGIAIGESTPLAPPEPYPVVTAVRAAALRGLHPGTLMAGAQRALTVSDPARVVLRAASGQADGQPVLAASRLGRGLVIVASRHTLALPVPPAHQDSPAGLTRLLTVLARWSRRPAEWAAVPAATTAAPLELLDGPLPVDMLPPPLAPPPETATVALPGP